MRRSIFTKALACFLAAITAFSAFTLAALAAADGAEGKYVQDVYVAYGEKTRLKTYRFTAASTAPYSARA